MKIIKPLFTQYYKKTKTYGPYLLSPKSQTNSPM